MFVIRRHTTHGLQLCLAIILQITIAVSTTVAAQTNTQLDRIVSAIQQQLAEQNTAIANPGLDWTRLREFYAVNEHYPVWVDIKGPLPKATVLRKTLQNADAEGLDPQIYNLEAMDSIWPSRLPENMAQLDLLLTDALLAYSVDVSYGRFDPAEVDPQWHITRPNMDALVLLRSILANEDISAALRALPPSETGYQRLRAALARYQRMADNGGWSPLAAGPLLEFGAYHSEVAFLRQRLRVEGDLELRPIRDEEFFDRAVEHAVERFQVRHGLKMDGIVGPATRAVMNVPVTERIEKIKLNMERWRWLPRHFGQRYIMVNTAGFELMAFENRQPRLAMWVIIGTPDRQTPVLSGRLHTIVFNPYWTVPKIIAVEELIPKQRRNPNFFSQRAIRVYRKGEELDPREVDWSKVNIDYLPYTLRQDPGPRNPLGQIKFLFSNRHQIYLHDTPKQSLFNQPTRAFSHGCVRVEDPLRLANFILGDGDDRDEDKSMAKDLAEDKEIYLDKNTVLDEDTTGDREITLDEITAWDEDIIKAMMDAEDTVEVPVPEPIPIYLVYWTAWVAEGGGVFFRPDIYERDPPNCAEMVTIPPKSAGSADTIQ